MGFSKLFNFSCFKKQASDDGKKKADKQERSIFSKWMFWRRAAGDKAAITLSFVPNAPQFVMTENDTSLTKSASQKEVFEKDPAPGTPDNTGDKVDIINDDANDQKGSSIESKVAADEEKKDKTEIIGQEEKKKDDDSEDNIKAALGDIEKREKEI